MRKNLVLAAHAVVVYSKGHLSAGFAFNQIGLDSLLHGASGVLKRYPVDPISRRRIGTARKHLSQLLSHRDIMSPWVDGVSNLVRRDLGEVMSGEKV